MTSDAIIRCRNLCKRFGDLVVLDNVNLDFGRGRTTAIIGPSGTGKSVLLKHLVGLLRPDSGEVWIGDTDMASANDAQIHAARKRFGMLFQDGALFDSMTAGENVAYPLRFHTRLNEEERRQRALEVLDLVELADAYDRPTSALSGGQRKRVGLARAIVLEPEIVLFDEPNSGLDPLTSDTIDALIGRMKLQLGITFIVITHDIVSAVNIADDIGMLYGGRLIAFGDTASVVHSREPMVRAFLKRNLVLPDEGTPGIRLPGLDDLVGDGR
ncbi:MAG: ABC transporter ATP-binding protein [Myxococcota bacterium]